MNTRKKQERCEFVRMYQSGAYSQKEIARAIGVTEATVCVWAKTLEPAKYCNIRNYLATVLERVTKEDDYEKNKDTIARLISGIERVDRLIKRSATEFLKE